MIARGKRLGARALALSLLSGVIVGVTGAAGENTTVAPQGASIQASAFVRPATAVAVSLITPVTHGHDRGHGDGVSQPVVLPTPPVPPGHSDVPPAPPAPPAPVASGNGNGNGNGFGHDHGNGDGNGNGNGQGAGKGQGNGDPGSTGSTGPGANPGSGQTVPPGDPGTIVPTGDGGNPTHDHGHHGGDGQGNPNSGQTNIPLPVPTPTPVTVPTPSPGGTVAHTPVSAPVSTPVTTPATGVSTPPATKPTSRSGSHSFKVSGLAPVTTKKNRKTSHGSSPLLSAANSGISVPLSRAAANLARMAGTTVLGGGSAANGQGSGRLSGSQTATAAARAAAARQALAHKKPAPSSGGSLPAETLHTVTQIVRFIPTSIWIALAASLGLALMGATAAVTAARRARRHAHRVAEVSAVALTDPLTGVLNRRGFIEAAERELDRAVRHGRPFTLSYIDVRGLKRVNDGEGHLAGDQLLKAATAALTDSVRAHDVVGRLGGDEFGVLLAEQTSEEAAQVTERISDQVTVTRAELAFAAHWDLTVGTASFPQDGTTIDQLLAAADRRLYEKRGIALAAAR